MKALIFAGPSISDSSELGDKYKNFIFLPPAGHSDLISNVEFYKPDIVGLIDDYAGNWESVWHNELVYILEMGIKVFGAAGVGAIRAYELEKYGIKGVGKVFEHYKLCKTISDSDVICLFNQNNNFLRLTEPMVNINFTLDSLQLTDELKSKITSLIREIYWKQRTRETINNKLEESGISKDIIHSIWENYHDVQKEDAKLLFHTIQTEQKEHETYITHPEVADGNLFQIMYERDRTVRNERGEATLNDIACYAGLNHPEIEDVMSKAMNREIVAFMANYLGISVSHEEISSEKEIFMKQHNISGNEDFLQWLEDNDINEKEFDIIIKKLALNRRMHKWFTGRRKYRRFTSILNEELILNGEYNLYKDKTIEQEVLLAEKQDKIKEKFNNHSLEYLTAKRLKGVGFPYSQHPFDSATEFGFSKSQFKLALVKEDVIFDEIKEKLAKIFNC